MSRRRARSRHAFQDGVSRRLSDLSFNGVGDLIAEGDYVAGRWQGGGTHTGPAFSDFRMGSIPAASGCAAGLPLCTRNKIKAVADFFEQDRTGYQPDTRVVVDKAVIRLRGISIRPRPNVV